ncbi:MAG: 5-formyltetrahydrofolate cyclo-ligase [Helicobacteraceae bacterium]|nr:5-formyltetrahydrofolate cyclo-ligase [Helicobacteraceae bacterium]
MTKNLARANALKTLKAQSAAQCLTRSAKTRHHLRKLLDALAPKSALIYLPMRFEADLMALFRPMRATAKLYAPRVETISFKMVKFRLPLKRHTLGFFEPRESGQKIKKVEVMIVPAIAVDALFRRIGFGKGMYDRFFSSLRSKPIVIFVQPILLRVPYAVTTDWDIRGDFLVSAKGVIVNKGTLNDRNHRRRYSRVYRSVHRVVYHAQN